MGIQVRNLQRARRVATSRLRSVGRRTLSALGCPEAEVGSLLVTDRRIRALNRRYRGEDSPTDVLAFPQGEGGGPPGHPGLLGDVVISVETAASQAARAGSSLEREAALLLIHGILHLLGHDHATAAERRRMWAIQRRLLRGAAAPPP